MMAKQQTELSKPEISRLGSFMSTSPEEKIKQAKALTRKYMSAMEKQSQRPICHMRFIPY